LILILFVLIIAISMYFTQKITCTYGLNKSSIQKLMNKVGLADMTIHTSLHKVALSTECYFTAYGDIPNGLNFIMNLPSAYIAEDIEDPGCDVNDTTCLFGVQGTILPLECNDSYYKGSKHYNNQCYFYYEKIDLNNDGIQDFRISAKSHINSEKLFIYESVKSQ